MRIRASSPMCGLLCVICAGVSTLSRVVAQTAVQRDQQALIVIAQTIAAGGGQDLLRSIQDLTETGNVTYYWSEPVTATVTIKSRGLQQFRTDTVLSEGQRSTIVNGGGGSQIEVDGTIRTISGQSASDLGCLTFPYPPLIAAMQDSSTNVIYVGLVAHNGTSAYDVRIQKTYSLNQDPQGTRGAREARDFYIDSNALVVVAISDQFHSGTNDQGLAHEIDYSNYQPENGVMMPLQIAESANGAPGSLITIGQVVFNSGLNDADFTW